MTFNRTKTKLRQLTYKQTKQNKKKKKRRKFHVILGYFELSCTKWPKGFFFVVVVCFALLCFAALLCSFFFFLFCFVCLYVSCRNFVFVLLNVMVCFYIEFCFWFCSYYFQPHAVYNINVEFFLFFFFFFFFFFFLPFIFPSFYFPFLLFCFFKKAMLGYLCLNLLNLL